MIESDFTVIEETLGFAVPSAYRRVMSPNPFEGDRPSESHIPDHSKYVCSLNQQIRDDGVYGDLWRPSYFAVGTSWEGDAFVLDTGLFDSPVFKFCQEDQTVTTISRTLDEWVARLRQWYLDFDAAEVVVDYQELVTAIGNAGFFTTTPEPMDGWHRVCVMSERNGGSSFWIAPIGKIWLVGAWSGNVYRVPGSPSDFCIACFSVVPCGVGADFAPEIKTQFSLKTVTDEEFERLVDGR